MQKFISLPFILSVETLLELISERFPLYENDSDAEGNEGALLTPFKCFSLDLIVEYSSRYAMAYVNADVIYKRQDTGTTQTIICLTGDEMPLDIASTYIHAKTGGKLYECKDSDEDTSIIIRESVPILLDDKKEMNIIAAALVQDIQQRLRNSLAAQVDVGIFDDTEEGLTDLIISRLRGPEPD